MARCCPHTQSERVPLIQGCELDVSPVFPSPRGHARLRLPAASRPLSWVLWASVPHASGPVILRPLNLRYYALLRLPSSLPVGSLLAPDRYLGLTRCASCSARLAPRSARSPSASNGKRPGVVCAGHPHSGDGSQGDGRFSRVPGLPLGTHAPLSDPGGVPSARLDADRTAAFRTLDPVGFQSGCPDLSFDHHYTFFGVQFRGLHPRFTSASHTASRRSHFGSATGPVASLWPGGIDRFTPTHPLGNT